MIYPLLLATSIGLILGSLNYFYWKSKGYSSYSQWFMSVIAFFGLTMTLLKFLY